MWVKIQVQGADLIWCLPRCQDKLPLHCHRAEPPSMASPQTPLPVLEGTAFSLESAVQRGSGAPSSRRRTIRTLPVEVLALLCRPKAEVGEASVQVESG